MGKNKKLILITITFIFCILCTLIGMTYSFFMAEVNGNNNTNQTIVETAELRLVYTDTNVLYMDEILPGRSGSKIFTIENKSDVTLYYSIKLIDVINEFVNDELVYTLTSNNGGTNINSEVPVPTQTDALVSGSISPNTIQTYELTITFKETGSNQNSNMGAVFSGMLQIELNENDFGLLAMTMEENNQTRSINSVPNTGDYIITYNCNNDAIVEWDNNTKKLSTKNINSKTSCTVNFIPVSFAYEGIGYEMLYADGDESTKVTGGWINSVTYTNGWTTSVGTKNLDSLYLYANVLYKGINFTTSRKVDLAEYQTFYQKTSYTTSSSNNTECSIFTRLLTTTNLSAHTNCGAACIFQFYCAYRSNNQVTKSDISNYNSSYYIDFSNTSINNKNSTANIMEYGLQKMILIVLGLV